MLRVFVVLAVAAGCRSPSTPAAGDALWGLAPAGARGAIVITPRGVAMLESGASALQQLFDSSDDFALAKQQVAEWLAPVGGAAPKLADFGFAATKGAALFVTEDGLVAILPVVDRDTFLARTNGTKGTDADTIDTTTCKLVRGHYACASSAPLLDTLGRGDLKKHLAEVKARGDIELVGADLPLGEQPVVVAAVIQLARGAGTLRGTILHPPLKLADMLTHAATPKLDMAHSSGFALLDLRAWLPTSSERVVGSVTLAQLLDSLDGPLTVATPAGAHAMTAEQHVYESGPLQTLVDRCGELPGAAAIDATATGGTCHFKIASWDLALAAAMDGGTLRIGPQTAGKAVPLTQIGSELARGSWALAFWGRGTMLAGPARAGAEPVDVPAESAVVIRLMALLNEVGFAARRDGERVHVVATVRTLFSNPDPVLAKLLAITAKDIAATRGAALAEPIAKSSPSAPFAHDFAAGHTGLLLPTALVGAGVSLVVPALMMLRSQENPATTAPSP